MITMAAMTLVRITPDDNGTTHDTKVISDPMNARMTRALVKYLIGRKIFDAAGRSLDVRTSVALFEWDDDGGWDLKDVCHPDTFRAVRVLLQNTYPDMYAWHYPR